MHSSNRAAAAGTTEWPSLALRQGRRACRFARRLAHWSPSRPRPSTATLAAAGAGVLGLAGLLLAVDPAEAGNPYPPCPFLALTGLACPGCGGLRAAAALLRGDLFGAAGHNVLLVLVLPLALVAVVAWAVGRAPLASARTGRRSAVVLGLALVFGVARNLPWGPLPGLGP